MHLNPDIARLLEELNHPSLPGIDLSLERMMQLLEALGNPHTQLPSVIHAAGTNGKGSTLAFLQAIYTEAGYRVHRYTSPHLVHFNERITLAGNDIDDATLWQHLQRVHAAAQKIPVTFFEATTALAFLAFANTPADVLLLETGMGGRLDATNVVAAPLATLITPIDYDHMEFLGGTIAKIAGEKAGIIKRTRPCIVGKQHAEALAVLDGVAAQQRTQCTAYGRDWSYEVVDGALVVTQANDRWKLPLPALAGSHQQHNAALASVVVRALLPSLPVDEAAIRNGVQSAKWPARLQPLQHGPLVQAWGARGAVMLDGGHNPSAALVLADWLSQQRAPVTLLCGMMRRKDAQAFLQPLAPYLSAFVGVPIAQQDAYDPATLAQCARAAGIENAEYVETLSAFADRCGNNTAGTLLIAGSLFLAGDVLKNHS
jgi:dihydrofolate synthase/folylpolyglutamate synthase